MVKIADCDLAEEISVYARISVDTEKESDSNTSIENQLKIINAFIQQHFPKCTVKEYVDRDRSGYTFAERENYMKMRERLFGGQSKIVVIKDFSRFSRRLGLGIVELEELRDIGVRVISVMDGIDYPKDDVALLLQVKMMMDELPVTETSKKVRGVIEIKQRAGEWLCAVPYGYIIKNQKKNIVEIVPDEAEIIKEIFRLYSVEGWGYKKIANYLTDKKIPTPRMKEKERAEEADKDYKRTVKTTWSIVSIQTILRNDYYIGTFRGHKYTRKSVKAQDVKVSEDEHIVIEKHHKAIIDDKTFMYTQELLGKRTTSHYRGVKKYETPYTGYLFCGDCGAPMFSRSTPRLAPCYICGTYHRRGLKDCSAHHIRVDFLDTVLKDYIRLVKMNCHDMMEELEKTIASETKTVKDSESVIKLLEKQLGNAREELKAIKKQKIRDIAKNPEDAEIIEETYEEIENEITHRIYGYQAQLRDSIEKRSSVVEIARVAKTVFDVFDDILNKEKLSKMDISLIVDKIEVFENGLVDVHLKADIDSLLKTGNLPNCEALVNFNFDSIGISFEAQYTQKSVNQPIKAYTVNVISEGDPLEIYTDRDGEVIFKKYSPVGELASFAGSICETLNKTTGATALICDRDTVIAAAGPLRRELSDKRISEALERIIESRQIYQHKAGESAVGITDAVVGQFVSISAPIISEGDVSGCVVFAFDGAENELGETGYKLAQTVAGFLGKQMES